MHFEWCVSFIPAFPFSGVNGTFFIVMYDDSVNGTFCLYFIGLLCTITWLKFIDLWVDFIVNKHTTFWILKKQHLKLLSFTQTPVKDRWLSWWGQLWHRIVAFCRMWTFQVTFRRSWSCIEILRKRQAVLEGLFTGGTLSAFLVSTLSVSDIQDVCIWSESSCLFYFTFVSYFIEFWVVGKEHFIVVCM